MIPQGQQREGTGGKRKDLSLSSAFPSCWPLFSVALGQHGRSCLTVVHFSPHSFTLLCLLSVPARHHAAKQDPSTGRFFSFPLGWPSRVLEGTMNYLFARIIGKNTLDSSECPQFSTQPDLPPPLPFRVRALYEGRRLGFHGCYRDGAGRRKKETPRRFLRESRIIRFASA